MMEGISSVLFAALHIIPETDLTYHKDSITICQINDFQIWRYTVLSHLKIVSLNLQNRFLKIPWVIPMQRMSIGGKGKFE